MMKTLFRFCCVCFLLFDSGQIIAAEATTPLPEPLTLKQALQFASETHPDLRYVNAGVMQAVSQLQQATSDNDIKLNLDASANWFEPSPSAFSKSREEHYLALSASKSLYDFGRNTAKINMATEQLESQKYLYQIARQNHYLDIMKKYFAVVLADLQFYRYNEEMSVAFIRYDRIQNRFKLGQSTEVEVAEKEAAYQKIRRLRMHSQNQQRITRALLAQVLNHPGQLPATVSRPRLQVLDRKIPEVESVQQRVLQHNPLLKSLQARMRKAEQAVAAARLTSKPDLSGYASIYQYAKETPSSAKWRAGLQLSVPLWDGERVDAAVAAAQAELYRIEAEYEQQKRRLQQQALELVMQLEILKIRHEEAEAAMNFTELSLDRNRALYELEVKSDLGDAMVRFSEAERNTVKITFDMELAWATLDALTGDLLAKAKEHSNGN